MTEQRAPYSTKIKPEIRNRILSAASALTAEGIESPTNDQVRERMGGGSLSHISPVMRQWRQSRKADVVAALDMPADLKRAVDSYSAQIEHLFRSNLNTDSAAK